MNMHLRLIAWRKDFEVIDKIVQGYCATGILIGKLYG